MKRPSHLSNVYALAHRAMVIGDRIQCGPANIFCDGGAPAFVCPAHGGLRDDEDWWDDECAQAYSDWQQAWTSSEYTS